MKKFLFVFILCLFSYNIAFAQSEAIGDLYDTDVKIYIKDIPIEAFSTGDKIVIECESLEAYGFFVRWSSDERVLRLSEDIYAFEEDKYITNNKAIISTDAENLPKKYYSSDIVTVLNGTKIESYNIGGKTIIPIDAMAECGYKVNWSEDKKEVKIYFDKVTVETDIGMCNIDSESGLGSLSFPQRYAGTYDANVVFDSDSFDVKSVMLYSYYTSYVPLKLTLDKLNLPFEWNYETDTFTINFNKPSVTKLEINPSNDLKHTPIDYDLKEIKMNIICNGKQYEVLSEYASTAHADMRTSGIKRFDLPVYEYKGIIYVPISTIKDILNIEI